MKKRLFAYLLCVSLVLGMLPGNLALTAKGAATDSTDPKEEDTMVETDLHLEADGSGYCPVCGKTVKWRPVNNGGRIGDLPEMTVMPQDHHYYFADENTLIGKSFLQMNAGNNVCLHLNGKKITFTGGMSMTGGTLNLLGDGHVDFADDTQNAMLVNASSNKEKKINIYGGTYTSSTGKGILNGSGGNFTVNMIIKLFGDTNLDGLVKLTQSQLYLQDNVKVTRIEGSNTASIRVDKNWQGSATVDYFTDYLGDYISAYNGRSTGDYSGKLMLADGRQLVGESGKLRILGQAQQEEAPKKEASGGFFAAIGDFFRKIGDFFANLFAGKKAPAEEENPRDRLWFAEPAPDTGAGFEQYSLPIGNGYMGVTVFGGTESELLSISDKEMFHPKHTLGGDGIGWTPQKDANGEDLMLASGGGYTNMCKAYIDFGHEFDKVTDYRRDLLLETAEARVRYTYDGVTYDRTYFASYPDNVTVVKLDASKAGKLTFTLRPTATHVRAYSTVVGDGLGKTGSVAAVGDTAVVSGTLTGYNVNYEAQFKVIPTGGTMRTNTDGTITVENADSAVILLSVDTNYELNSWTLSAPNAEKLDPNSFPHEKITAVINAAAQKSYEQLRQTHLEDYQALYCSVEMDLGGEPSDTVPLDKRMQAYRAGEFDPYVEELLFKFGRYLLIASSRSGTLPANLQGVWQYYTSAAWNGSYVYNINLQMNYWSCFATNLAQLFEPNIEFFDAVFSTLQSNADNYLAGVQAPSRSPGGNGANGIAIGVSGTPYVSPTVSTSVKTHTGPGSTGYTSDLFWQYYQFTMDEEALKNRLYPYLEGAATFLSKTLEDYDGKLLVSHSASPENNLYFKDRFVTVGTMFDQMMVRESFVQLLEAARLLQYTSAESPILDTVAQQLDKLDPVNVGKSGHVKEYREETYYGDFGLYEHHGMGQLVGVYPGTTITNETDAWQDAAATTAIERGINFSGHQASFKHLVWARLGNAENSYLLAQEHIVKYIRDNLLNTHVPFQIDGNFGYTAGVAEMLIQSHEGYIRVLPALPKQWNTGYYKGLTARGGFEVDVAWENGNATEIAITSNAGKPCSLNHFRASGATVTDSKGNPVSFTVDSDDQITFATEKGETYYVAGLQKKPVVELPADLTLTGTQLSWEASADAVSYKVYRAVNDQPAYELVAEHVKETTYTYEPADLKEGNQLILRVTAVNADGVESDGIRTITWIEG